MYYSDQNELEGEANVNVGIFNRHAHMYWSGSTFQCIMILPPVFIQTVNQDQYYKHSSAGLSDYKSLDSHKFNINKEKWEPNIQKSESRPVDM